MRVDRSIKQNPPIMSYKSRRMPHLIGELGVTVRLMCLILINGPLNASNRTGTNMAWPLDRGWTLRMNPRDVHYKTHQTALVGSRSDDRDAFLRVKSWQL